MLIVGNHYLFTDAAYRTAWKQKNWRLNGRKAIFYLFFRPETAYFATLFLESEPTGKLPFPVRSLPVFYPLRRYENKWDFHQLMSTKNKMHSRRFCSQKKKQAVSLVDFGKSAGLLGGAISFLPLFWLYFNWRIYEYGDKVKVLISWKSVGFKPLFWWKSVEPLKYPIFYSCDFSPIIYH